MSARADGLPKARRKDTIQMTAGTRYGNWTVLGPSRFGIGGTGWLCRCDCGTEKYVQGSSLRCGDSTSCGCIKRANRLTHGHARRNQATRTWRIWRNMIGRCGDKNNPHYGKKGIQVCAEWRTDYQRFLADMGEVPSPNHSIDRIDSNGHYEPNNCRWATDIEQARNANTNRVMEFQGRRMTMAEASEVYGIAYSALQQRMTAGWSAERALTTPVRVKRHA